MDNVITCFEDFVIAWHGMRDRIEDSDEFSIADRHAISVLLNDLVLANEKLLLRGGVR